MARPFAPELLDELEASMVDTWAGTAWRHVFTGTDVLRANRRGARWNPPDVEALYCSLSVEVAIAEIDYLIARQPVPITRDRVSYRLDLELTRIVDLSERARLEAVNLDITAGTDDLIAFQHVGAACAWLSASGLLVPSLRGRATNLVVFVNNMHPEDRLSVTDEEPYEGS